MIERVTQCAVTPSYAQAIRNDGYSDVREMLLLNRDAISRDQQKEFVDVSLHTFIQEESVLLTLEISFT